MRIKLVLVAVVLIAILAAWWHLRYGGTTHEQIVETVENRAEEIKDRIDLRSGELDRKLDRIESKLDRLLQLADRPLPDGMKEVH